MKRFIYIIIASIFIGAIYSCAESDDFSSDGNLKLTFSRDTVSFDTVFTSVGSATQNFRIYNRNKKSVTIESIEIVNPQLSGFRMNIDGESGTRLTAVDVLKRDSLYGFLEVTVDPQNKNNPVLIRDSIRFVTNGNVQYLYLEAVGRDVHIWKKKTLSTDTIITDDKPILVYDTLCVNKGIEATIKEGVEFYFHKKASLYVRGKLKAEGEVGKPIIFRGDRLDYINGPIPYDRASGQWNGVVFDPDSYDNYLENVEIRNAVNGIEFLPSDIQRKKANLINTVVHNSSENGISAVNCNIDVTNCQITNARNILINLTGGKYSFLHCTIANYYRWSNRIGESVVLKETEQCDFINSIIYGTMYSELNLSTDESGAYKFINCLIRNKSEYNDAHFVNAIWNADPKFQELNQDGSYRYDFKLQETSSAIDQADRSYSLSVPFDMNGQSRLSDAGSDIGCYEWVKE